MWTTLVRKHWFVLVCQIHCSNSKPRCVLVLEKTSLRLQLLYLFLFLVMWKWVFSFHFDYSLQTNIVEAANDYLFTRERKGRAGSGG